METLPPSSKTDFLRLPDLQNSATTFQQQRLCILFMFLLLRNSELTFFPVGDHVGDGIDLVHGEAAPVLHHEPVHLVLAVVRSEVGEVWVNMGSRRTTTK
jgi:hypothetical protein